MSNLQIIWNLLKQVKSLWLVMIFAIIIGTLGFLSVILLPFILLLGIKYPACFIIGLIFAISRGILRYMEQGCNHYIAFKLLAIIRDKVFSKLIELAPSKLDQKNAGNLIYLMTTDVEALEVFYAHTISPIIIAIFTNTIIVIIISLFSIKAGIIAFLSYIIIGFCIPYIHQNFVSKLGQYEKKQVSTLSTIIHEDIANINAIKLLNNEGNKLKQLINQTNIVNNIQNKIKIDNSYLISSTNIVIIFTAIIIIALLQASPLTTIIPVLIILLSSYGPVIALSNLSNNLVTTFASAKRIIELLEEQPTYLEIKNNNLPNYKTITLNSLSFNYPNQSEVIKNLNYRFELGKIYGIHAPSGSGKSTLLKLLMQYYQVAPNSILFDNTDINNIDTKLLRSTIAFLDQNTVIFNRSIKENINVANLKASDEEIINACKKAHIHDRIMQFPNHYDEINFNLSEGEKQRIGLARAFLSNAKLLLLDEPTSNLDILTEAEILSQLECRNNQIIIIVSHRKSTLKKCDKILEFYA